MYWKPQVAYFLSKKIMTKLTKRQTEILTLIEQHIAQKGSPPTRAEIARLMGFRSPNAAEDHLRALAKKKVIELVPGTSRGIRIIRPAQGVPMVRDFKQFLGLGSSSQDTDVQYCQIDTNLFTKSVDLSMAMLDQSLEAQGIQKGDLLFIHLTQMPPLNGIVLIRQFGQFHFKHLSANALSPPSNLSVEGVVVGSLRIL